LDVWRTWVYKAVAPKTLRTVKRRERRAPERGLQPASPSTWFGAWFHGSPRNTWAAGAGES